MYCYVGDVDYVGVSSRKRRFDGAVEGPQRKKRRTNKPQDPRGHIDRQIIIIHDSDPEDEDEDGGNRIECKEDVIIIDGSEEPLAPSEADIDALEVARSEAAKEVNNSISEASEADADAVDFTQSKEIENADVDEMEIVDFEDMENVQQESNEQQQENGCIFDKDQKDAIEREIIMYFISGNQGSLEEALQIIKNLNEHYVDIKTASIEGELWERMKSILRDINAAEFSKEDVIRGEWDYEVIRNAQMSYIQEQIIALQYKYLNPIYHQYINANPCSLTGVQSGSSYAVVVCGSNAAFIRNVHIEERIYDEYQARMLELLYSIGCRRYSNYINGKYSIGYHMYLQRELNARISLIIDWCKTAREDAFKDMDEIIFDDEPDCEMEHGATDGAYGGLSFVAMDGYISVGVDDDDGNDGDSESDSG